MSPAIAVLGGLLVSLTATRVVELIARRRGVLDEPNERSSHEVPTPRLGGFGILAGTGVALILSGALVDGRVAAVAAGGVALAAMGFVDDVRRIPAPLKLAAQTLAAAGVVLAIDPTLGARLPGAGTILLPEPASWVLAVLWVVAVCNAINFMDGIDGLVASCVGIAAVGLGLLVGNPAFFLALAAGCAGFLVWNRSPATIFMGDTGSQFVGFVLAAGLLLAEPTVPLHAGLLVLSPLLFDVTITLVRRIAKGRQLFSAHREHIFQGLAERWGHGPVAAGYALCTLLCATAAMAYMSPSPFVQWTAVAGVGAVLATIVLVAGRSGVPDAGTVAQGHRDG